MGGAPFFWGSLKFGQKIFAKNLNCEFSGFFGGWGAGEESGVAIRGGDQEGGNGAKGGRQRGVNGGRSGGGKGRLGNLPEKGEPTPILHGADPEKSRLSSRLPPKSGPATRWSRPRESDSPGARNPHTSGPLRGACSGIAGILKSGEISEKSGENSGNSRRILVGGLWIPGMLLPTLKNRESQAVSPRNRARRRAVSDPPDPTPRGPETPY